MISQNLPGTPYVDAKTYQGWKEAGFIVKKGQHSTIEGITWIKPEVKLADGTKEEGDYLYPKVYNLFHRTQVEAITK